MQNNSILLLFVKRRYSCCCCRTSPGFFVILFFFFEWLVRAWPKRWMCVFFFFFVLRQTQRLSLSLCAKIQPPFPYIHTQEQREQKRWKQNRHQGGYCLGRCDALLAPRARDLFLPVHRCNLWTPLSCVLCVCVCGSIECNAHHTLQRPPGKRWRG